MGADVPMMRSCAISQRNFLTCGRVPNKSREAKFSYKIPNQSLLVWQLVF